MRFAAAALCVLALTGSAQADYVLKGQFRSPCHDLPPMTARQAPSVPFYVTNYPFDELQKLCSFGKTIVQPITACVPNAPDSFGYYEIRMPNYLSDEDYACVLTYEKAHLPPNNWFDNAWEAYMRGNGPDPRQGSLTELSNAR